MHSLGSGAKHLESGWTFSYWSWILLQILFNLCWCKSRYLKSTFPSSFTVFFLSKSSNCKIIQFSAWIPSQFLPTVPLCIFGYLADSLWVVTLFFSCGLSISCNNSQVIWQFDIFFIWCWLIFIGFVCKIICAAISVSISLKHIHLSLKT